MEGTANANLWRELSDILSPSFTNLLLSLEPSASVSAEPVSNQIPRTTDTRDAAAEKACAERYGNHQTLDYASAEQERFQGQDRAEHIDPEINDKTLNYISSLGYGCPNTDGSNSEANGDNHQTLIHFLQKQPASCYCPNIASTSLEINVNKHQTQPASYDCPNTADTSLEINVNNHQTFDYLSAQPGSSENPKAAYTNRKRKSPEDSVDPRSRKRITDKAYRDRCKEDKNNTKAENGRLKTEIDRLKDECTGKNHILLDHKEEIKKLQQHVKRLEGNIHTQTTVVEVLSEQLASVNNIHLQRENTHLKSQIDILRASIDSPTDSIIRQFQERNDQLQREKNMLRMIVEALCQKINDTREEAKVANPSATKDQEIFLYTR